MCKLRFIKLKVKRYNKIVTMRPERAKKNCHKYYKDLMKIKNFLENFEASQSDKFLELCDINIQRWDTEWKGYIHQIKMMIVMEREIRLLNKYASNVSYADRILKMIRYPEERLNQFIIWKEFL